MRRKNIDINIERFNRINKKVKELNMMKEKLESSLENLRLMKEILEKEIEDLNGEAILLLRGKK